MLEEEKRNMETRLEGLERQVTEMDGEAAWKVKFEAAEEGKSLAIKEREEAVQALGKVQKERERLMREKEEEERRRKKEEERRVREEAEGEDRRRKDEEKRKRREVPMPQTHRPPTSSSKTPTRFSRPPTYSSKTPTRCRRRTSPTRHVCTPMSSSAKR